MKTRLIALLLSLILVLSAQCVTYAETERETITIGMALNVNVEDYDTNAYTRFLEEELNIDIKFYLFDDIAQKLPVMINSNDTLPDMLCTHGFTIGTSTLMDWAEQGVILPLTEYWNDQEMTKHFDATLAYEGLSDKKQFILGSVTMPNGEIYTLPSFEDNAWNLAPYRAWVNSDWLEALDIDVPTTTDEFFDMLKRFAEEDPNGNGIKDEIPMIGAKDGVYGANPVIYLMNAFIHACPSNYANLNNGVISFAYMQDAYKEALQYINSIYEAGYLDSASFTQDKAQLQAVINGGDIARCGVVMCGSQSNFQTQELMDKYILMAPLTGPEGVSFAATSPTAVNSKVYITKYATNPELCFKLAENNYDAYWRYFARFGVEGEQWTKDPEIVGKYIGPFESIGVNASVYILEDVWGKMQNAMWNNEYMPYISSKADAMRVASSYEKIPENENVVFPAAAHYEGYGLRAPAEMLGTLAYTDEERATLDSLEIGIKEYMKEMQTAFATGAVEFDQWDAYISQLKTLGVEEYLEIMQTAYDRTK